MGESVNQQYQIAINNIHEALTNKPSLEKKKAALAALYVQLKGVEGIDPELAQVVEMAPSSSESMAQIYANLPARLEAYYTNELESMKHTLEWIAAGKPAEAEEPGKVVMGRGRKRRATKKKAKKARRFTRRR